MAPNCFPRFADGNVEIRFTRDDDKFVLHSHALALHSRWFKASLSERWNVGDQTALVDGKNHWTYELRFDKNSEFGMFMQSASTTDMEFIDDSKLTFPSGTPKASKTLKEKRVAVVKAHQDTLSALYHIAPSFSTLSFEEAKSTIQQLIKVSEAYGCEGVLKIHVDSAVCGHRLEVLSACYQDPMGMIEFAAAIKCGWVFKEAAINIVGKCARSYKDNSKRIASLGLSDLFKTKRAHLLESMKSCDLAMLSLQPRPATNAEWERHTAVAFFRHWLSKQLQDGRGSTNESRYAAIYAWISNDNSFFKSNFGRKEISSYLKKMIATKDPDKDVERLQPELELIFKEAAVFVQPLLVDNTQLQDRSPGVCHDLRCAQIEDSELPWMKK